jgi:DNA-binding XRE family transcriptional regulator
LTSIMSIVGCLSCGKRSNIADGEIECRGCLDEHDPNPLREWRTTLGMKIQELADDTTLTKRTIIRAEQGERMSHDVAANLARHTGKHWRTFRPKKAKT